MGRDRGEGAQVAQLHVHARGAQARLRRHFRPQSPLPSVVVALAASPVDRPGRWRGAVDRRHFPTAHTAGPTEETR